MHATIAAAGGGFTPRKRLSSSTPTKQTLMYVCDVCASTFSCSTNHANLRSHKGGQGCTSHLEAHKATRPLDKFLRKGAVVSGNNDRPPNPAMVCQGFFRQRVTWHGEVLDTTLLHDAPATAQWIPHPHNQFSEVRRNADVPVEHKGTIKSRGCTFFATKPNSSAPTYTYVWQPPFVNHNVRVNICLVQHSLAAPASMYTQYTIAIVCTLSLRVVPIFLPWSFHCCLLHDVHAHLCAYECMRHQVHVRVL